MNRPHFRRHPRPTDPDPEYSRLDRLDGLGTRYDTEWPDVIAAEAPGGDLAAMAAPLGVDWGVDWRYVTPLPGMARDDLGTYAEPVEVHIDAEWTEFRDTMARLARAASVDMAEWTEPSVPADPPRAHGRHRQTDPLDLILADLRDLGGAV